MEILCADNSDYSSFHASLLLLLFASRFSFFPLFVFCFRFASKFNPNIDEFYMQIFSTVFTYVSFGLSFHKERYCIAILTVSSHCLSNFLVYRLLISNQQDCLLGSISFLIFICTVFLFLVFKPTFSSSHSLSLYPSSSIPPPHKKFLPNIIT